MQNTVAAELHRMFPDTQLPRIENCVAVIIHSLVPSICMFRREMEPFHNFPFVSTLNMHSVPFMVNAVLFVKVIFSVKTADNPGPCWSAPIPVPPHLPSLFNSVFLVCFHIPSLPPSLTVAFMLSLLCSSSLYLLSVSLLSVSLYICSTLIYVSAVQLINCLLSALSAC